jgi:hypothetical protein
MKTKFLNTNEKYDGAQLVSLRGYLNHGLLGDSIVAWVGPCDVTFEHMIDGEDLLQQARIAGDLMLHFIVEKFDVSLFAAVGLQRLLADLVRSAVVTLAGDPASARLIRREGDDLFLDDKKLSISIATQTPVSSLIHFAVNVINAGTPVATLALEDLGIDPRALAEHVIQAFAHEVESIHEATMKVRWGK